MEKIKIEETKKYHPKCPHCEGKLSQIDWHKVQGTATTGVGYVAVYSCPHCRKVLGVSANQG